MKKIAVVYGGFSSEYDISIKSGKNIAANIDKNKYEVYEVLIAKKPLDKWSVMLSEDNTRSCGSAKTVEIDKSDFSFMLNGQKVKFDLAYIIIHGSPGENGILQAYFEMIGQSYVGCNSFTAALSFDKYACKSFLKGTSVHMAKDFFLRKSNDSQFPIKEIVHRLTFPMFVKPNNGGSSYGISKVKKVEDLSKALDYAFAEDDTLIIEEQIKGQELTCAVYPRCLDAVKNNKVSSKFISYALPVTEIIPETEYFDYEAKYLGKSAEICPAQIDNDLKERIQKISVELYDYMGCSGLVRIDYIYDGLDIYFLEVNLTPGMTAESIVPKMVKVDGLHMTDFLTEVIENR
ncbi:MAG: D-alanine--D-alanine ligase family protein [Bacteroidales bacterium]